MILDDELVNISESQIPHLFKNMLNSKYFCENQMRFVCKHVLHNIKKMVVKMNPRSFRVPSDSLGTFKRSKLFS